MPSGRGPSSRGLSRAGRPTPSSMTWPPTARATGAHSPFGVAGHVDPPAEGDAAGGQGLGQGGFAPADLAGQEDVGVGQHALLVEDPGVVAEGRARPGVLADQDAGRAQSLLGQERVGAGQDLAGGPVRGEAQRPPGAPRCGPGWPRAGRDGDRRCSIASRLGQSPPVGRQPAAVLDLDLAGRPQLGAQRPGMGTRHVAGQAQHPPAVTRIRGRRRRWRQVGGHVGVPRHRRRASGAATPHGIGSEFRCRRRIRKRCGPGAGRPG